MTILSDRTIESRLNIGERPIVVTPTEPELLQPSSIDLRLSNQLLIPQRGLIDPADPEPTRQRYNAADPEHYLFKYYALSPGCFVLGATLETVSVPSDLVGVLTGKSSLARLGLQIECAGYVDPGWRGQLTMELTNLSQSMIVLRPGMRIAQIRFEYLSEPARREYGNPELGSHYQDSQGPVAARFTSPEPAAPASAPAFPRLS